MTYKFVELSLVTDETIENAVNEWVAKGWYLDGIRFVTTDASSPEKSRSAHALTKVLVPTQKFSIWQIQPVFSAIENLRVKTIPLAIFARIRDVSGPGACKWHLSRL